MMRQTSQVLRFVAVLTAYLVCHVDGASGAVVVKSDATGADLAGANVTVTFFGGPMATATVIATDAVTGKAMFPGSFAFEVSGDTSTSDWKLTNLDAASFPRDIVSFVLDTTDSISLFDNGSAPSTPDSGPGVLGATYVSGPPIADSFELNPWGDAINAGDMFTAERVSWGGFEIRGIIPGEMAVWHTDTDRVVPEPCTYLLAIFAAASSLLAGARPIKCRAR